MNQNDVKTEWCLLQNQFEDYEKQSLLIKLVSVFVVLAAEVFNVINMFLIILLLILWLQDAIWKTFQSRFEPRLLTLERCIREDNAGAVFQFNSDYQKLKLTGLSLIAEYVSQSIRPTVAFPHVVLTLLLAVQYLLY